MNEKIALDFKIYPIIKQTFLFPMLKSFILTRHGFLLNKANFSKEFHL